MCEYTIHPLVIVDGIDVIYSPGHTAGGQSVSVNTSDGKAIITGFCCNDKNFPSAGPAIAAGVHIDLTEAYDSIQKIKGMADILLPLHDLSIGRMKAIPYKRLVSGMGCQVSEQ